MINLPGYKDSDAIRCFQLLHYLWHVTTLGKYKYPQMASDFALSQRLIPVWKWEVLLCFDISSVQTTPCWSCLKCFSCCLTYLGLNFDWLAFWHKQELDNDQRILTKSNFTAAVISTLEDKSLLCSQFRCTSCTCVNPLHPYRLNSPALPLISLSCRCHFFQTS